MMKDFPVAVSDTGLHIMVDDILTPKEAYELIGEIKDGLFRWHELTGEKIDQGKPK